MFLLLNKYSIALIKIIKICLLINGNIYLMKYLEENLQTLDYDNLLLLSLLVFECIVI